MNFMNKTVDVKLTEKEEKAIATMVAFFQGLNKPPQVKRCTRLAIGVEGKL